MRLPLRPLLLQAHRCMGLLLAGILIVAGLTGSIAAFHDSLDAMLNPDLFRARTAGSPLSLSAVLDRLKAQQPHAQIRYLRYRPPPGQTMRALVQATTDPATRMPFAPVEDEVFLDPVTGQVQGTRASDGCCLNRHALIPFLYRFHYTLGLGRAGEWIMGISAMLWSLDCLVGLALTLPGHAAPWRRESWRRWGRAWRIKLTRSRVRLTFDLHRAVALWLWIVMLGVAVSGVALTLPREVFHPVVAALLPITLPPPEQPDNTAARPLDENALEAVAIDAASRAGWHGPPDGLFKAPGGTTSVFYFRPGSGGRRIGFGNPVIAVDDRTGRIVSVDVPRRGRVGDTVLQLQFPWHSGEIAGLPGRIVIATTGLAVAILAITGLMIWQRKRHARRRSGRLRGPRRHRVA